MSIHITLHTTHLPIQSKESIHSILNPPPSNHFAYAENQPRGFRVQASCHLTKLSSSSLPTGLTLPLLAYKPTEAPATIDSRQCHIPAQVGASCRFAAITGYPQFHPTQGFPGRPPPRPLGEQILGPSNSTLLALFPSQDYCCDRNHKKAHTYIVTYIHPSSLPPPIPTTATSWSTCVEAGVGSTV